MGVFVGVRVGVDVRLGVGVALGVRVGGTVGVGGMGVAVGATTKTVCTDNGTILPTTTAVGLAPPSNCCKKVSWVAIKNSMHKPAVTTKAMAAMRRTRRLLIWKLL